jgi:hypothetical protein
LEIPLSKVIPCFIPFIDVLSTPVEFDVCSWPSYFQSQPRTKSQYWQSQESRHRKDPPKSWNFHNPPPNCCQKTSKIMSSAMLHDSTQLAIQSFLLL